MAHLMSLICIVIFALNALAATHNVSVANFTFTPSQLIISSGDSVHWHNSGGFHNVAHLGEPQVFRSGDPSSSAWDYYFEFNDQTAAVYPYVCDAHASQGMAGVVTVMPLAAGDDPVIPSEFKLSEAYPNPFNPNTHIDLNLPAASALNIDVYNSLGQRVVTLFSGFAVAGTHTFAIDGASWASGLYFVKATALGHDVFKKIVLLK